MDSSNNPFNPHPHPRPHPHPTPVPPPSPPSPHPHPHPHPNIIVVVLVTFGCLLLLGACVLGIWWLIKKRKGKKHIQERKNIDVDEHLKVQETIMPGRSGKKKKMARVEDDIHVHKDAHRDEFDQVGEGIRGEPKEGVAGANAYGQHLTNYERQAW